MIPRTIHYCWFGGKAKSPLIEDCIASWRRFMPDFEIHEWNETNYDYQTHPYTREAYKARKWAFVSDYARLDILYRHGGIYFDTDVEVLKPFDIFLTHKAFCGQETSGTVATGLVTGSEPGNEIIRLLRDDYDKISFLRADGTLNLTTCPMLQTATLEKLGFQRNQKIQEIGGLVIYPAAYFCPRTPGGRPIKASDAYSVHYYSGSWQSARKLWKKRFLSIFGEKVIYLVKLKHFLLKND